MGDNDKIDFRFSLGNMIHFILIILYLFIQKILPIIRSTIIYKIITTI